ncbi:MAG: helix-turn-helix transcriptional regulator [Clostridium sp.]
MENDKCGELIQSLRKQRGMTQRQLAELLNVSDRAVSKWERGESYPEVTTLVKISEILRVSTDELLKGKVSEENTNRFIDYNLKRFQNRALIGFISISISIFGVLQFSYGEFTGIVRLVLLCLAIAGVTGYFIARKALKNSFNNIDLSIVLYGTLFLVIYIIVESNGVMIEYVRAVSKKLTYIGYVYEWEYKLLMLIILLGIGVVVFYKQLTTTYSSEVIKWRNRLAVMLGVNLISTIGVVMVRVILLTWFKRYSVKTIEFVNISVVYAYILFGLASIACIGYIIYRYIKVSRAKTLIITGFGLVNGVALFLTTYFGLRINYGRDSTIVGEFFISYLIVIGLLTIIGFNLVVLCINNTKKIR